MTGCRKYCHHPEARSVSQLLWAQWISYRRNQGIRLPALVWLLSQALARKSDHTGLQPPRQITASTNPVCWQQVSLKFGIHSTGAPTLKNIGWQSERATPLPTRFQSWWWCAEGSLNFMSVCQKIFRKLANLFLLTRNWPQAQRFQWAIVFNQTLLIYFIILILYCSFGEFLFWYNFQLEKSCKHSVGIPWPSSG